MQYLDEKEARSRICDIGNKMYEKEYVAANDGNISLRISEDEIIVTPTGVSKGGMKENELVKMSLNGQILSAGKPSSEVKMHLKVYNLNSDVQAVLHAHPPLSTAFAVARIPLDKAILAESIINLGVVPVADYALTGTKAVPAAVAPYVREYNAVLLANHGLLTWGESLKQAFFRMETAEQYCKIITYLKSVGDPVPFTESELEELINLREKMGIKTGGRARIDF